MRVVVYRGISNITTVIIVSKLILAFGFAEQNGWKACVSGTSPIIYVLSVRLQHVIHQ